MPEPTYRVRRALTDQEMVSILGEIDAAGSTREIIEAATRAVFRALLQPLGESLDDYGRTNKLNPGRFALPEVQLSAIIDAAIAKAAAFGARTHVALGLVDVLPYSYDDPSAPVPEMHFSDQRPAELVLSVTREATDVITAASAHCEKLGTYFGTDSREYQDAVTSWQRNLSQLFSMGMGAATRVSRDAELSLLVRTESGLDYGVIFHAEERHCTRPGCSARIDDDGSIRPHQPDDPLCLDGRHIPSYGMDAPRPGTWLSHS